MNHTHHIIPKHMGGTDDHSNLYECTVEEHSELHFALYLEHGRWEDWCAAMGLSGQIGKEEIISLKLSEASKKAYANKDKEKLRELGRQRGLSNKGKTPWNKGRKMSEEEREKMRNNPNIKPPSRKVAKWSQASRDKLSATKKGLTK